MNKKLTSALLAAALLIVPATATAEEVTPFIGPLSPKQQEAQIKEDADARVRATVARQDARVAQVATELQQTQERAAQMSAALNSEDYQAYLAAMRASQGDIRSAVQLRAQQIVLKESAELAKSTKWTSGFAYSPGSWNLAAFLQTNRRLSGGFGNDSDTLLGLRMYLIDHAFRIVLTGAVKNSSGFTMPDGAVCAWDATANGGKGQYVKVNNCSVPDKDGKLDSGAPAWTGVVGLGVGYHLLDLLHVVLGYNASFDSYAYTAIGETQTSRSLQVQHALDLRVGTTWGGMPLSVVVGMRPLQSYISPSGVDFRTTQWTFGLDLSHWIR